MSRSDPIEQCIGFEWDGNLHKNWERHQVTPEEAEDVFFQESLVVQSDIRHSDLEERYYALGHTRLGRRLFAVFTVRGNLIRVISARDMNRNERNIYATHEKDGSQV